MRQPEVNRNTTHKISSIVFRRVRVHYFHELTRFLFQKLGGPEHVLSQPQPSEQENPPRVSTPLTKQVVESTINQFRGCQA